MTQNEQRSEMGFLARLVGVFASPTAVFEDLKGNPKWLVPLLVVALAIPAMNAALVWSDKGESILRQQIEGSVPPNTPEDAIEQQIGVARYAAPGVALIVIPVFAFLIAGLLYLVFSIIMGGEGSFRQTLSVQTHSGLIGLLGSAVQTSILYAKGEYASSPTALSAFLPFLEDTSFVYKLFQGFDLFLLWQLAVLSIGIGIVQQTGTKKSATVIFAIFLAVVIVVAGIRQAFS